MQKFFGEKFKGHKRRRLRKLAAMLCGLMRSKKPSMIALGRGLPIYWIVKKKPKGHFKSEVHVELIKRST